MATPLPSLPAAELAAPLLESADNIVALLALYDAVAALKHPHLTLWEHNVPGAEYALRLWATANKRQIEVDERNATSVTWPVAVIHCTDGQGTLTELDITVYVRKDGQS